MLHGKSLSPILLALAGGLFLLYLAWPQTVGGLLLVSQERTLDGLAGARYTPPLTSAGLVQAVANWRAAAPRLDDCDTWTGLGDVLTAAARGADAASGLRDALLREAIAAYRKALALGPANARAWTMLTAARLEYDATPAELIPLLPVSDALVLVRQVDKVILLVRWEKTKRETAMTGLKLLLEAGADVAGIALTQVDMRKHASYDYSDSGYYYASGGYKSSYIE